MRRAKRPGRQFRCLSMLSDFTSAAVLPSVASAVVNSSNVFISELHYDNVSTDADEFVEVSGPAGLLGVTAVLVRKRRRGQPTPS
jgi:hypothetical protein